MNTVMANKKVHDNHFSTLGLPIKKLIKHHKLLVEDSPKQEYVSPVIAAIHSETPSWGLHEDNLDHSR